MPLMDRITDTFARISTSKSSKPSSSMSGGIGHGMVPLDDDVSFSSPLLFTWHAQLLWGVHDTFTLPVFHSAHPEPPVTYTNRILGPVPLAVFFWCYVIMLFFLRLPIWNGRGRDVRPANSPFDYTSTMGAVDMGSSLFFIPKPSISC